MSTRRIIRGLGTALIIICAAACVAALALAIDGMFVKHERRGHIAGWTISSHWGNLTLVRGELGEQISDEQVHHLIDLPGFHAARVTIPSSAPVIFVLVQGWIVIALTLPILLGWTAWRLGAINRLQEVHWPRPRWNWVGRFALLLSLTVSVYCAITCALHKAEMSHRTFEGCYFDHRDEPYRGGFSATVAWPIGPLVVDENLQPIEERLTAYDQPPKPRRREFARFGIETGQFQIHRERIASLKHESQATINLMFRPKRYVRLYWPRWWMGVMAVMFAIAPVLWARRAAAGLVRRRRVARGLCAACGYDLRASKDRCPECGAALVTELASA